MSIRVLLADPDEDLLRIFDELLSLDDFEIATATTGPQCVALLRQFMPGALVLELDLPDGWSERIMTMMRSGLHVPSVPTVILSRFEARGKCLEWPMVKRIHAKPMSIVQLKDSLRAIAQ